MLSEPFSAIMMVAGWMLGEGIAGITEASTTRRPSRPCTLELAIDHRGLILAHAASSAGMIDRARDLPDKGANIVIGDNVRARPHLAEDQRTVGFGGDDLPAHVKGGHRAAHVVVLGIGEVVGKDFGLGAARAVGELDLAAALGPADAKVKAEAGPAVQSQGEVFGGKVGALELEVGDRLAGT